MSDPGTDFVLPLSGRYRGQAFRLANRGFKMRITGIPIPFDTFEIRGVLGADYRVGDIGHGVCAERDRSASPPLDRSWSSRA